MFIKKMLLFFSGVIILFENILSAFPGFRDIDIDKEIKQKDVPVPDNPSYADENNLFVNIRELSDTDKSKIKVTVNLVKEIINNRVKAKEFSKDPKKYFEQKISKDLNVNYNSKELKILTLLGDEKALKMIRENDVNSFFKLLKDRDILSSDNAVLLNKDASQGEDIGVIPILAVATSYITVLYTVFVVVQLEYKLAIHQDIAAIGGDDNKSLEWKFINFISGEKIYSKIYRKYLKEDILPYYLEALSRGVNISKEELRKKIYKDLGLDNECVWYNLFSFFFGIYNYV